MHLGALRHPDLLDRLRSGPVGEGDDHAWDDLGLLVGALMERAQALPGPEPLRYVPHEIVQYWDEREPPDDVAACMDSWIAAGIPVRRFDREAVDAWLQRQFGGDVVTAFRYVHHPSMQSDLFRMARLYHDGGLYVDADDLYTGSRGIPAFRAGSALLPLAVCRHCPASKVPRAGDPVAAYSWYYLGSSPWFSRPRHPFVARSLERAVAAVMQRRSRGERSQIHDDVGPGCVSMAALDHVRACVRSGDDWDIDVAPSWGFVEQSQLLAYKSTPRNWRSNAALYGPDGAIAA